jgi:hypothetical protein
MNVKELRIGNLVFYPLSDTEIEIDREMFAAQPGLANLEDYRPIPLTEEWLLKFGFELDISQIEFFHRGGVWMHFDGDSLSANFGHIEQLDVEIKYVHQLQNLYFALTGEELTIQETLTV